MADAQAGKNAVATIVTDQDGNGSIGNLAYGTYYVKETKASPGYRVNNKVYIAAVTRDTPVTFDVPEEAGGDPASVLVQKKIPMEQSFWKIVFLQSSIMTFRWILILHSQERVQLEHGT